MVCKRWPVVLAILVAPGAAAASTDYPDAVKSTWRVKSLPVRGQGCLLCHTTDPGRLKTATQPFGLTLQSRGIQGRNPAGLARVLIDIATEDEDSDRDGTGDYEEVYRGTNPSDPADKPPDPEPAGAGGAGGASGDEGGRAGAAELPSLPPPTLPDDYRDLPPPLGYGCSIALPSRGPAELSLGAALLLLFARRRSQRAR